MPIKTILNRVQKFKSLVYGAVRWNEATSPPSLEVELRPRANGWARVFRVRSAAEPVTIGCRCGASSSCRCGG